MFVKKGVTLVRLPLIVLVLIGCNILSITNPEPTSLPPTQTPVPPTATLTPEPPTATPIPIIAQAKATFTGQMTISSRGENANAKSGEIELETSADGTAIVSMTYSLSEAKCTYVSGSSSTTITGSFKSTLYFNNPVPIKNGKFNIDFMGIQAIGNLSSPTEANGKITIDKEETTTSSSNQKFTCHYGTWNWTANVK